MADRSDILVVEQEKQIRKHWDNKQIRDGMDRVSGQCGEVFCLYEDDSHSGCSILYFMVEDHSDSERRNPLQPLGLLIF